MFAEHLVCARTVLSPWGQVVKDSDEIPALRNFPASAGEDAKRAMTLRYSVTSSKRSCNVNMALCFPGLF